MGSFIPSTSDNEICDNLTLRFSNQRKPNTNKTWLQHLQAHNAREPLFAPNRSLVRVAYRLAVSVAAAEVPAAKRNRHRWFHMLRKMLPPETDVAIRRVLSAVLDPANNIPFATFTTKPDSTINLAFELFPHNSGAPALQPDGSCLVKLLCKTDAVLPDPTTPENDPPTPDPNEQGLGVGIAKKKKTATKYPGKKKSAKKSAKRPAKKTKAAPKKVKKVKKTKAKKGKSRR